MIPRLTMFLVSRSAIIFKKERDHYYAEEK